MGKQLLLFRRLMLIDLICAALEVRRTVPARGNNNTTRAQFDNVK